MSLRRSQRLLGLGLATLAIALTSLFLDRTSAVQALAPKSPEFVSSLGGEITSLAISGTVVFAGQGYSLTSLDVSDPAHIAFLSNAPLPDFAVKVQISGTNAYVADGAGGLQIVDIADPRDLKWRANYATDGAATDVAIVGSRAYVAVRGRWETVLQIVDVANPAAPGYLGSFSLGVGAGEAAVDATQNTAFLVDRNGLTVLNVDDPVHPAKLGGLHMPNGATDVRVSGDRVVTVGEGGGGGFELDVIDAHTPLSPTIIGRYMDYYAPGCCLDIVGNLAYTMRGLVGLTSIDLTMPTTPTLKTSYPFMAVDFKVSASRAFLANTNGQLQVVDLNAAPSSSLIGQYELLAFLADVKVKSNYAFAAGGGQSFQVIDTSNPQSPVLVTVGPFPGYGNDVTLDGDAAYVNRFDYGVDIFSIQIPSSPALLASYNPLSHGSYMALTVDGNYAYVGEALGGTRGSSVNILDVGNPSKPLYISSVDHISDSGPQAMKRVGNILYIAAGNGGLVTVDVGNPMFPSIRGRASGFWAAGLDVVGDVAFVSGTRDALYVFDVSNPLSPTVRAKYPAGDASLGKVLAVGDRVFVAELYRGLLILDAVNPSNPKLYLEYPICPNSSGAMQGFDVAGDNIYLACRGGGFGILHLPGISPVGETKTHLPLLTR